MIPMIRVDFFCRSFAGFDEREIVAGDRREAASAACSRRNCSGSSTNTQSSLISCLHVRRDSLPKTVRSSSTNEAQRGGLIARTFGPRDPHRKSGLPVQRLYCTEFSSPGSPTRKRSKPSGLRVRFGARPIATIPCWRRESAKCAIFIT
jgi:hypothetical protein